MLTAKKSHCALRNDAGQQELEITIPKSLSDEQLLDAHEASDVSAINGIISLAHILRKRDLLSDADISALYESMSLPLGMTRYASNPAVQDIQSNLDQLFAMVIEPH
jgi:hypothetical protein